MMNPWYSNGMMGNWGQNWGWMMSGYGNSYPMFGFVWPWVFLIVIAEIVLKGVALYRSARNGQTYWFIALLILNTLGILPIIYLIWFDKKAATRRKR